MSEWSVYDDLVVADATIKEQAKEIKRPWQEWPLSQADPLDATSQAASRGGWEVSDVLMQEIYRLQKVIDDALNVLGNVVVDAGAYSTAWRPDEFERAVDILKAGRNGDDDDAAFTKLRP